MPGAQMLVELINMVNHIAKQKDYYYVFRITDPPSAGSSKTQTAQNAGWVIDKSYHVELLKEDQSGVSAHAQIVITVLVNGTVEVRVDTNTMGRVSMPHASPSSHQLSRNAANSKWMVYYYGQAACTGGTASGLYQDLAGIL